MIKNEYKILVSTKPTKASLGVRRKFSLDYFGRMIVDLLGGLVRKELSRILPRIFKMFLPQDSHRMLPQTLRSIVGVFTLFKNMSFQIILKKRLPIKYEIFLILKIMSRISSRDIYNFYLNIKWPGTRSTVKGLIGLLEQLCEPWV